MSAQERAALPRSHYARMGQKAAEYRRQERLLLGKPAWAIKRDRDRKEARS